MELRMNKNQGCGYLEILYFEQFMVRKLTVLIIYYHFRDYLVLKLISLTTFDVFKNSVIVLIT